MITGINELKTLKKYISCKFKCKFDGTKCKSTQWWNNKKCLSECKKTNVGEKDYVWNSSACNCENGKYLASIMDDSKIICDKFVHVKETTFNEEKVTCKAQSFYILHVFLLITIALLKSVSIYSYLLKY